MPPPKRRVSPPSPKPTSRPEPPHSPPACPGPATASAGRALDPLPHLRQPRRAPRASPHPAGRRLPANTSRLALPGSCLHSTGQAQPWAEQPAKSGSSGSACTGTVPAGCTDGDGVAERCPGFSKRGLGQPQSTPSHPAKEGTQHRVTDTVSQLLTAAVPAHKNLGSHLRPPTNPLSYVKPPPHPTRAECV